MRDHTHHDPATGAGWPQRLTIDFHTHLPIDVLADILLHTTNQLHDNADAFITAILMFRRFHGHPDSWDTGSRQEVRNHGTPTPLR